MRDHWHVTTRVKLEAADTATWKPGLRCTPVGGLATDNRAVAGQSRHDRRPAGGS